MLGAVFMQCLRHKIVLTQQSKYDILRPTIEVHFAKSTAQYSQEGCQTAQKRGKCRSVRRGGRIAGSAENIRPVVAEMRSAIIHTIMQGFCSIGR